MQKLYLICNKYFFWLLVFLLAFIPLYPKFPLVNISGTYVAVRLEDILIAGVVFLWTIFYLPKLKSFFNQPIFQAFLLFWLIGGISLFSGIFLTSSVQPHLGLLHWLRRVEYMSLFLVMASTIQSVKQLKVVILTLLITTTVVILYGFGQVWLNFPVISTTNREFSKGLILYLTSEARVNSTFAGHYDLAIFLSLILTIIAGLFLYTKNLFQKFGLAILGGFSLILLGLTAARMSFVAAFAGLSLIFWLSKKRLMLVALVLASCALIVVIPDLRHRLVATFTVNVLNGGGPKYTAEPDKITIYTDLSKYPPETRKALREKALQDSTQSASESAIASDTVPGEPINTTELGVYRSWGIRLNVEWPRAIKAFLKNPFLGTGYSSLTIATDNDYLRSLGETGILGFLSLCLIFIIIIKKILLLFNKVARYERFILISILAAIITLLITAVFIDVFEASKVAEIFWLVVGASWILVKKNEDI